LYIYIYIFSACVYIIKLNLNQITVNKLHRMDWFISSCLAVCNVRCILLVSIHCLRLTLLDLLS